MFAKIVWGKIVERHNVVEIACDEVSQHVQIYSAQTNDLMSAFLPFPAGTFAQDQLLLVVEDALDGTFVSVIINVYLAPPFELGQTEVGLREIQIAIAQALPLADVTMIGGGIRMQTPNPIAVNTEDDIFNAIKEALPYLFN